MIGFVKLNCIGPFSVIINTKTFANVNNNTHSEAKKYNNEVQGFLCVTKIK